MSIQTNNILKGNPIDVLVRLNPEEFDNSNLRVFENKITLLDKINKPYDDFISKNKIIQNDDSFQELFSDIFEKGNLDNIIQGMNFTAFLFGEKNSGKSFCLQSNEKEMGVYEIVFTKIFSALENKKDMLLKNLDSNNFEQENKKLSKYSYNLKLKFIEIKDEKSIDLLQKYNYFKQPAEIVYSETEGYSSVGSVYVNVANLDDFKALLKDSLEYINNDKNQLNGYSTILTLEISQLFEFKINSKFNNEEESIENDILISKLNIIELPSANILLEKKNDYNKENFKSIFSFQNLISELVKSNLTFNIDPDVYEFSNLTKLIKEYIGMNSICLGIFNLKKNNFEMNELIFKIMKLCQKILCYPVKNDTMANILFRKFRNEILFLKNEVNKSTSYNKNNKLDHQERNNKQNKNQKFKNNIDNEEYFSNDYLNVINPNQNTPLVDQLKNKIKILDKEISRLENELKLSQEEKIKILNNFNINNGKMQSTLTPYDNRNSSKNVNPNHIDMIDQDIKEQLEIMNTLNKLQDKLRLFTNEKRVLEEDNLNLKSAYIRLNNDIEVIKSKNSNLVNNLNGEILQLRSLLNSTKAEIEFLRNSRDNTVKLKDNVVENFESKHNEYEIKINEIRRECEEKLFEANSNNMKIVEKVKRDLSLKNDSLLDEVLELKQTNQDFIDENKRLILENDEIRNSFKDLLSLYDKETKKFNFLENQSSKINNSFDNPENYKNKLNNSNLPINKSSNLNNDNKNLNTNINNNLSKLTANNIPVQNNKNIGQTDNYFEVMNRKEKDLEKSLSLEITKNKNLMIKNKNLKLMIRKLKNVVLDFYPTIDKIQSNNESNILEEQISKEENEIFKLLYGDLEQVINNQESEGVNKFYEFEIKQLRDRIIALENEVIKYKSYSNQNSNIHKRETLFSNYSLGGSEIKQNNFDNKIQTKILEEIDKLKKSNNRSQTNWQIKELDKLKFENFNLKEEIIKIKRQLIVSSKIKDNSDNNKISGYDIDSINNTNLLKKLHIKNNYLEKAINKLEKENVELKIKANSAEEQLNNLQKYIANMNKMRDNLI